MNNNEAGRQVEVVVTAAPTVDGEMEDEDGADNGSCTGGADMNDDDDNDNDDKDSNRFGRLG